MLWPAEFLGVMKPIRLGRSSRMVRSGWLSCRFVPARLQSCTTMREVPFLPRRHSVRLQTFDYSQPCVCFITVCTQHRQPLFGQVAGSNVRLSPLGKIVESCWQEIPRHVSGLELSEHVVMPNHFHGIVILKTTANRVSPDRTWQSAGARGGTPAKVSGRAQHAVPLRLDGSPPANTHSFSALVPGSLQVVVRSFKSAATKRIREHLGRPQFSVWQRGFYERIIWNEKAFHDACEYIQTNPANWEMDEENPARRC
jgi:putative transposase